MNAILLNPDTYSLMIADGLLKLGRQVLTHNLGVKSNDSVVVVTDPSMLQLEAQIWIQAAKDIAQSLQVFVVEDMTHSGQEPPQSVIDACGAADVSIFQTKFSLTHTRAGKAALLNAGRAASLPGANLELLLRTLAVDPAPMKELGEQLRQALSSSQQIVISTTNGTNLKAMIRQNAIFNDCATIHEGEMGNLPGGEVFFAPLLGTANGTVVIDGSIADDILDEPILIEITDGRATSFAGGLAAHELEKKLLGVGKNGMVLAEIGIGTNPNAKICNNLLEAEKAYGTVHVAFGNSSAISGENNVPIHLDGLISQPLVAIDGKSVLEKGSFFL